MAEMNTAAENTETFFQHGLAAFNAGNYAKAAEWYGKAAEQGNVQAQISM